MTDSNEELYFTWWLDELVKAGYIHDYQRSNTYMLFPPFDREYIKIGKKNSKFETQSVFQDHVYTPDFDIHFTSKAHGIFCQVNKEYEKIQKHLLFTMDTIEENAKWTIEIKGGFLQQDKARVNSINRKWLFERHGIFTNLVKIPNLFVDTFTPARYLLTDSGKMNRNIKYKPLSLEQYVNKIQNDNNQLL